MPMIIEALPQASDIDALTWFALGVGAVYVASEWRAAAISGLKPVAVRPARRMELASAIPPTSITQFQAEPDRDPERFVRPLDPPGFSPWIEMAKWRRRALFFAAMFGAALLLLVRSWARAHYQN